MSLPSSYMACGRAFFVGLIGGWRRDRDRHWTLGFISGYKGGLIDEGLNVLCNVELTIPGLVLLILIAGFLHHTSPSSKGS